MKNIAILIVSYNPSLTNLKKILNEFNNNIYISDNGSENYSEIKTLVSNFPNSILINNKENLGIATAQNKAIHEVIKNKQIEFVLFLDQDSFITRKTVMSLEQDYLINNGEMGILTAIPYSLKSNIRSIKNANETLSSGMLVSVKSLKLLGGMREELFIDMVDYELCWRFKKYGLKVAQDYNCRFVHQIGNNKKVFGKIIISPIRLYYVYRNTIYLMKKNYTLNKKQNINLLYRLFKQFIFNTLFCDNKIYRLKNMYLGLYDGIKGKMGKFK
ncbi:glycosyltransferase [Limosilactobacillus reuteri]|uniref:glycosyltransferase n=1 Tax=Limosilactobacillus reuteri TaxID=1598 RepID=UPI00143D3E4B|nr:glycosyltransferase [Limosilactobacillus reuteri]QIZ04502.1 glycosyltransferase [Limosilactobacillus reuteri]